MISDLALCLAVFFAGIGLAGALYLWLEGLWRPLLTPVAILALNVGEVILFAAWRWMMKHADPKVLLREYLKRADAVVFTVDRPVRRSVEGLVVEAKNTNEKFKN